MRCLGRYVQQLRVFGAAFHAVVAPREGWFKVVADLFVKLVVLLRGHVFFGAGPNGIGFIDGFPFAGGDHFSGLVVFTFFPFFFEHLNGQRNMVGVFVDNVFHLPGVQVVAGVLTQVQYHAGASLCAGDGFHLKVAGAATGPAHAFFGFSARTAGFYRNGVGHDEARVKTHTKLANQLPLFAGVGFLVATELAHEVAGAAFGNGAQVVNGLLAAHANAVVGDGERFGGFV